MSKKAERWLKENLDYQFIDVQLLQQALTHRSSRNENYERLEFLGDAVLDLVVSESIFRSQANADEGDLSRLRASLVNDSSLAAIATSLGLGHHLILGAGERKTGGQRRESILADTLEAIFGAVYIESGFDAACEIIERAFGDRLLNLPDAADLRDPKTQLQEWLQARGNALPDYKLVAASGPPHSQRFEVSCSVNDGQTESSGAGSSRRSAEQDAARQMLEMLSEDQS